MYGKATSGYAGAATNRRRSCKRQATGWVNHDRQVRLLHQDLATASRMLQPRTTKATTSLQRCYNARTPELQPARCVDKCYNRSPKKLQPRSSELQPEFAGVVAGRRRATTMCRRSYNQFTEMLQPRTQELQPVRRRRLMLQPFHDDDATPTAAMMCFFAATGVCASYNRRRWKLQAAMASCGRQSQLLQPAMMEGNNDDATTCELICWNRQDVGGKTMRWHQRGNRRAAELRRRAGTRSCKQEARGEEGATRRFGILHREGTSAATASRRGELQAEGQGEEGATRRYGILHREERRNACERLDQTATTGKIGRLGPTGRNFEPARPRLALAK